MRTHNPIRRLQRRLQGPPHQLPAVRIVHVQRPPVVHAGPPKPAGFDDAVVHVGDGVVHDAIDFEEEGGDDWAENGTGDDDLDGDCFGRGKPGAGIHAGAGLKRRKGGTAKARVGWRRGEAVGRVSVSCSVFPAMMI
ncbi:MAG: hypothetical protein Q9187_002339 [Circinaria calcarea]